MPAQCPGQLAALACTDQQGTQCGMHDMWALAPAGFQARDGGKVQLSKTYGYAPGVREGDILAELSLMRQQQRLQRRLPQRALAVLHHHLRSALGIRQRLHMIHPAWGRIWAYAVCRSWPQPYLWLLWPNGV